MRQGQAGVRAKFVQVEPRVSQTGASADEWVAVRPGTEGAVALGLAHVIMQERAGVRRPAAGRAGALVEGWSAGLRGVHAGRGRAARPAWRPRASSGWPASSRRTARRWRSSAARALAHTNGLDQALAVNALNALVGSVDASRAASPSCRSARRRRRRRGRCAICWPPRPRTQLLLLDEANPVFAAPPAWKAAEALRQVPVHRQRSGRSSTTRARSPI